MQPSDAGDIAKDALLDETARSFGRDLLEGIARYARLHGPWSFHITPADFEQVVPKMKQWGSSRIIARIPDEHVAKAVLAYPITEIVVRVAGWMQQDGRDSSQARAFPTPRGSLGPNGRR